MTESEKENIKADLRSVIQSTKGGIPLRNVQGDFRSLTGNFIPFSKFGYSSLEEMFRNMPDVVKLERGSDGEIVAHAVANQATKHLEELISRQRPSKAKSISKPRRPIGNQNWRPPNTFHRASNNFPSRPTSRNYQKRPLFPPPPQRPPPPRPPPALQPEPNYRQQLNVLSNNTPSQEVSSGRNVLKDYVNLPAQPTQPARKPIPTAKNNFDVPPRFKPQLKIQTQCTSSLTTHENTAFPDPVSSTQPLYSPSFSPDAPEFIPRPEYKPVKSVSTYQVPLLPLLPTGSTTQSLIEPGLPWRNPRSNKELVDNYAFINGLKCVYRPFEKKSKKQQKTMWLSQLILDDQKFLSYPVEMNTANEADEEAAKRAVEKLKIDPNMISLPIVPTTTPAEQALVVDQVRQIVSEVPNGTVHYLVQEQFKKKHKMRLPPSWLEIIRNEDCFRIDRADETHFIIFYEKSARNTPELPVAQMNGSSGWHSPSDGDLQGYLPKALLLPDTKDWDIYVTHAASTANICFRLIDYCDAFEELAHAMEEYFSNKNNIEPVLYPVCGAPYCAFVEDTWHRIIVVNLDESGLQVLCDFPDVGDSVWLETSVICEINKRFLQLPFQAFQAELAGLSCFSNDPQISEMLIHRVIGKALVAEPTERDEEGVSLVLYDTSTDDDININKSLLEDIFEEIVPPMLHQSGTLVDGFLGDILPTGDVRLHVLGRSTELLNLLLENVTDYLQAKTKENPVQLVSFSEVYGVLYRNRWHRAIPVSLDISVENKVTMLLIDIGIQTDIALNNISQLTGETKILSSFLPLAIRCHLNGISNNESSQWNDKVKEMLQQLVPEGQALLIKVANKATGNQLPVVDLFKRLGPNMELVSINQTLAMCFSTIQLGKKQTEPTTVERKLRHQRSFPTSTSPLTSPSAFPVKSSSPTSTPYSFIEDSILHDRNSGAITPPSVENQDMSISKQEEVPGVGEFFDVFVTSAANPNTFICQSRKSLSATSELFEDMQQFYSCEENICEMHQCLIKMGKFFALKHKDGFWYRVHIQEILVEDPFTMLVYLVDYGGFEMVKLSDVQILYQQFCSLPYQAISASLSGIQPVNVDYSPSNCLEFKDMAEEKNFVSVINKKLPKNLHGLQGVQLMLTLVDTSTPEDVYIHEELVKKGISKKI